MRNGWKIGIGVAGLAFLAACGGDGDPAGPGDGDELSVSEAAALSSEIVELAFQGWSFGQATNAVAPGVGTGEELSLSVAGVPLTVDYAVDVTSTCELGGSFHVSGAISGTIDDQTLAGQLALDVSTGMTDCTIPAERTTFTLNTNPALALSGSVAWDQAGLVGTSSFAYAGALDWSTADGRRGSCVIDVLVTLAQDGSGVESGTVCGVSVSGSST
ncbi:MAG: hypothetical protein R3266_00335 [Gemmatimonadota bacterium]|nr:hypothetical protein [Gemmatimonadota bacterium]